MKWIIYFNLIISILTIPNNSFSDVDPDDSSDLVEQTEDFMDETSNPHDPHDSDEISGVTIESPHYSGSGCPPESVQTLLSPDQRSLSILFSKYQVEAGSEIKRERDIKICNLKIPIKVPTGFRATIVKFDYRGYHLIPIRGHSKYVATYHFSNPKNGKNFGERVKRRKIVEGPKDKSFNFTSRVNRPEGFWSKCGKDFNLHVDSKIVVKSNPRLDYIFSAIDSIDSKVSHKIQLHVKWKRCHEIQSRK